MECVAAVSSLLVGRKPRTREQAAYETTLQLGCHRSINNNQSAQTGNTLQYCKHKPINVELHLYGILSLVSLLGHTKKVKTARGFTV
jgi:hypothetical protein